ncbi:MAG: hypothetical protein JWP12_2998 [Bacteroidetes bacterium]|nr:hypothetical protein [Bacteroidota bacterium]
MKTVLLVISLLFSGASFAQQHPLPVIVPDGQVVSSFIPEGWHLLDSVAYGDLNKDGLKDAVFVIESKDKITKTLYSDTIIYDTEEGSTARILIILFQHKDGRFRLAVQNNDFILRSDEGGAFGEPFNGLEIKNGALTIHFYGGSRERWAADYVFRFQNNDWFLIGALSSVYDDITHAGSCSTYNFSTKKTESLSFTGDPKDKGTTVGKAIKITKLKTFNTFIRPFTWEIEKDTYL